MLNAESTTNRRPIDRAARNPLLAKAAEAYQPAIRAVLEASGTVTQDLLHGTPLGHPLHPLVTDIPVGSWTVAAVLDTLELAGRSDTTFAADLAVGLGLAGATLAIASGYAEWSDTTDEPRTLGFAHALLNGAAFVGYSASLVLRRSGRRPAGIATAFAAYALVGLSGYIGGELSYGMQLGMRHTGEPLVPPSEFTAVLGLGALPAEGAVRAEFAGVPVLLSRQGDGVAAISAVCTHRGAPLDQGEISDGCVRCPWHNSVFRLADGAVVSGPATFPQPRFEARIAGDQVELRMLQEL
jgi:nitrite reductase/ring-hydroxylating ferredoxin subunit/uncharacterized membrane protein